MPRRPRRGNAAPRRRRRADVYSFPLLLTSPSPLPIPLFFKSGAFIFRTYFFRNHPSLARCITSSPENASAGRARVHGVVTVCQVVHSAVPKQRGGNGDRWMGGWGGGRGGEDRGGACFWCSATRVACAASDSIGGRGPPLRHAAAAPKPPTCPTPRNSLRKCSSDDKSARPRANCFTAITAVKGAVNEAAVPGRAAVLR